MDEQLKQRLVGAAVLVSLGVIFIPMVLDGSPEPEPSVVTTNMPPRPEPEPEFASRIIPLEEPVVEATGDQPVQPAETPAASVDPGWDTPVQRPASSEAQPAAAATDAEPAPAERSVAEPEEAAAQLQAWVVQLGSFAETRNAISLRDRLRAKGYTAFVQSARSEQEGEVTRVYVGPELQRAAAEAALEKLEGEVDLEGIVVRYPGG